MVSSFWVVPLLELKWKHPPLQPHLLFFSKDNLLISQPPSTLLCLDRAWTPGTSLSPAILTNLLLHTPYRAPSWTDPVSSLPRPLLCPATHSHPLSTPSSPPPPLFSGDNLSSSFTEKRNITRHKIPQLLNWPTFALAIPSFIGDFLHHEPFSLNCSFDSPISLESCSSVYQQV